MIHDSLNCIWFRPQERLAMLIIPEKDLLLKDQNSEQNSIEDITYLPKWPSNWEKNSGFSSSLFPILLKKKTKTQSSARRHQQPHQFPTRHPWRQWGRKPCYRKRWRETRERLKLWHEPWTMSHPGSASKILKFNGLSPGIQSPSWAWFHGT